MKNLIIILTIYSFLSCQTTESSEYNRSIVVKDSLSIKLLGKWWYLSSYADDQAFWHVNGGDTMHNSIEYTNDGKVKFRYSENGGGTKIELGLKKNFTKTGNWIITKDSLLKMTGIHVLDESFSYDYPIMKIIRLTETDLILIDMKDSTNNIEHFMRPIVH